MNYPVHKLEFLALKWAVTDKFHDYLNGGNTFEVYTDNNPLTYVLSTAKLDASSHRKGSQTKLITTSTFTTGQAYQM